MNIVLYNFYKKNKSTKRPDGEGRTVDVKLKDNCTVINPMFELSFEPVDYNYVYIEHWGRYYFITDYSYANGIYTINCRVDVLASYKLVILNTTANILYSSSSTSKNIVDQRIPVTGTITVGHNYKAIEGMTISPDTEQGAVILGITGKGSFGSYLMQDSTQVSEILDGVDNFWSLNVHDSDDAWRQIFHGGSASNCLKSAIAIPLVIGGGDVSTASAEQLFLGAYPCIDGYNQPLNGFKIDKPVITYTTVIDIPWRYSDWRRNAPYSQIVMYLPFIGTISLPTSDMITDTQLSIQYGINVTSGDVAVQYKGVQSNKILGTASGNIALATPYGSTGIDTGKLTTAVTAGVSGIVAGIGSAVSSGGLTIPAVLGIAGGMGTVAGGTISALGGTATGSGGLGGGACHVLDKVIHVYVISRETSTEPVNINAVMGKPFMGVDILTNYTGYIQTSGFQIQMGVTEAERNEVNSLMDSGVYLE